MAVTDVHILLEGLRVPQRGLDLGMAKEPLDLFERHPALKSDGSGSMTEDVRRDVAINSATPHDLLNFILHSLHGQTVVRCTATDEERRRIILPGIQIRTKGDFRFRVEVGCPAFATLAALNVDSMGLPVNVRFVESAELRHAARRRKQEIDKGLLPETPATSADGLKFKGCHRQALRNINTDRRNPADRILQKYVLLRTPFKEGIQIFVFGLFYAKK